MKKILLLVIDALSAPHFNAEIDNGRLPTFATIKKNSIYRDQCTTIFPSITQAALSSLITGCYPAQHNVLGAHWYREKEQEPVFFSVDLSYIFQKGLGQHLYDLLYKLNHVYLSKNVTTIFEEVDAMGMDAASINHLLYRGNYKHDVHMPFLFKFFTNIPAQITLMGPQQFMLGDFLNDPNELDIKAKHTGWLNWLGFHDNNSIDILNQLKDIDAFPAFSLAYFPANDELSHRDGPENAHRELKSLDKGLKTFLDKFGGLDAFLEQFVLVITGDHSQTPILSDKGESTIDLEKLLKQFRISDTGMPWADDDEIMICTNMRAAQLYFQNFSQEMFETVKQQLIAEPRIDQLMWRADLIDERDGYLCETANGRLHFWPCENEERAMGIDAYQNYWAWEGDLSVVDGRVNKTHLEFEKYPNAFERIAGILDSPESGPIWFTAKLGYEFYAPKVDRHPGGGSHGSLHLSDSHAPLLVCGAPAGFSLPEKPRLVDITPLCLQLLRQEN